MQACAGVEALADPALGLAGQLGAGDGVLGGPVGRKDGVAFLRAGGIEDRADRVQLVADKRASGLRTSFADLWEVGRPISYFASIFVFILLITFAIFFGLRFTVIVEAVFVPRRAIPPAGSASVFRLFSESLILAVTRVFPDVDVAAV